MFSEFSDNQNFVYVREVSQKEKRDMKTAFEILYAQSS